MSSPSSVGKSRFLPRRREPENVRPSSVAIGGSNVFTVAMWDGPDARDGRLRDERVELAHPRLYFG